jgi:hypothetical protein
MPGTGEGDERNGRGKTGEGTEENWEGKGGLAALRPE